MKNNNTRKRTRLIAYGAILSALSVGLLFMGSLLSVLDLTAAVLASLSVVFMVCEAGKLPAFATYAVTSLLSLLLLPDKYAAVLFAGFFGYYPIVKSVLETKLKKRSICIIAKIICFTIALSAELFIGIKFFSAEYLVGWYLVGLIALEEITFVIYDKALSRVITYYYSRLRALLRLNNIFK